ncbi:MAG: pseudouridine synthase [Clostridia bacterium]|nr:pseudouridine synthase [Clostridia bacterium]
MGLRLQKYLAEAGVASRRASEAIIAAGRVTINGVTASLGDRVEEGDEVLLDGRPTGRAEARVILMLYKPRGVVSTSSDPQGRRTVRELVGDVPERLYSVGRLDINSEGLLLMTNDGALAYRLTHPRYQVEKSYYAVCDGKLTAAEAAALTNGVRLEEGMTAPARVEHLRTTARGDTSFIITIHEGRNRQIRRMLEALGHRTLRLKRERFGPLALGDLKPGEYRRLTEAEAARLRGECGL